MADYDLAEAFKAIEDELIASMIRNLAHHQAEETEQGFNWTQWQVEQLNALELYRKNNQKKFGKQFENINSRITQLIRDYYSDGETEQERKILQAIKRGYKINGTNKPAFTGKTQTTGEFFGVNDRKLEALITATNHDMERAETAVLRLANDKYRKAIFNAQVYANAGGTTYKKAVDMAVKDMLNAGLNCVEYKNGARHTLSNYADMAIRTATTRAYLQGEGAKRKEWGISTVILNKRSCPCPKCLPFVGKVFIDDVWSGGTAEEAEEKGYPLLSTAIEQGLYHPSCKDIHTTYFEGISTPPQKPTAEEKQKAVDEYNQNQKAHYNAQQAKKCERISEYSLDEENKRVYKARAEQWREKEKSLKPVAKSGESGMIKEDVKIQAPIEYREPTKDDYSKLGKNMRKNVAKEDINQLMKHDKLDGSPGGYVATHNYSNINSNMRNDNWSGNQLDADDENTIEALKKAINDNTLDDNYILTRYVNADYLTSVFGVKQKPSKHSQPDEVISNLILSFTNSKKQVPRITEELQASVGKIIQDKAFLSTSMLPAQNIMKDKAVLIKIKARKGTHAFIPQNRKESECILMPSVERVVESIVFDETIDKWVITEVVK